MTQKETRLSAAVLNELHFYLRTPGGSLYGPVAYNVLTQWAEAGRVAAGDEVSHDRKLWMPATNLPGLKMEWMGRRADGKDFGPFNLMAVPHLVQHGILDPACTLTHRTTGRTVVTASLVKPTDGTPPKSAPAPAATNDDATPPPPHWAATPGASTDETAKPAPRPSDVEALHAHVGELERSNARHAAERAEAAERLHLAEEALADEKRRREEQARAAAELERAQTGRLNKAQDDLHTANLLLEAARGELERQKKTALAAESVAQSDTRAEKTIVKLRRESEELKRAAANLTRNLDEAKRATDDLAQRNAAEMRAQRLLNESLESKCAEAQSRIGSLQRDLAKAQEAAEALRLSNKSLESKCAEAQSRTTPLQRDLAKAQEAAEALRLSNKSLESKYAEAQSRSASLQRDLAKAQEAADALRREREESATQAAMASTQAAELARKLETAERQRAETERTLAVARKQSEAAERRADERQQENRALRAQLTSAREMHERAVAEFARELTNLRGLAAPVQWKVRIGKNLYGPVSTTDLFAWTADCRIAPDTEVSSDETHWSKAHEVPELRMEWNIQLVDGTAYGPVNLLSVSQLVQDGAVQPDAAVTHCTAGITLRATELAQPLVTELRNAIQRLQTDLAESRRALRIESETRAAIERHLQTAATAVTPPAAVPAPPPIVLGTLRARAGRTAGA